MPQWLRFVWFVVLAISLTVAVGYYLNRRVIHAFGLEARKRKRLWPALCLGPLMAVGGRLLEGPLGNLAQSISAAGFILVVATLIAAAMLAPVHALTAAGRALLARTSARGRGWASKELALTSDGFGPGSKASASEVSSNGVVESEAVSSRRAFVQQATVGVAVTAGFGSAFFGTIFGRHDYVLEEVVVPIPGLSPRLSGYRIAQFSDIHFGQFVGAAERRSAVEFARRARADLVVLTGDLLDFSARHAPELGQLTRELVSLGARDGVVAIPGNHDYYAGVDVVLGTLRSAGARVLFNRGLVVGDSGGSFALLGVDDVWAHRFGRGPGPDLERAMASVPEDLPRILLCHNPEFFPRAASKVALQLSGHTHGGQVNPGVCPADLLLRYVRGMYREQGSSLYVNRGFGTAGPPIRIAAPPEVTLVVLTAA